METDDQSLLTGYAAYKTFVEYHDGIHLGGRVTSMRMYEFGTTGFAELGRPQKRGTGIVRNREDDTIPQYVIIPESEGVRI